MSLEEIMKEISKSDLSPEQAAQLILNIKQEQVGKAFRLSIRERDRHLTPWKKCELMAHRSAQKRWRNKNKEYQKEYRTKNADKIKQSKKKYRAKNADKIKQAKKAYYILKKKSAPKLMT